jgi:hypothetical protein
MIICTLINDYGVTRIAKYDAKVPPYYLVANNKLFRVKPDSWSTADERLACLTPTYNQVHCPDVSELLEVPEQVAA